MTGGLNRRDFLQTSALGAGALALPTTATAAASAEGKAGVLRAERLTVEYAETPLGTDAARPLLSWVPVAGGHHARQTAYQIEVDGTWDPGRVESDRSTAIAYDGPALNPRTRYRWRVRVWDQDGQPSDWSAWSWWETGFLGSEWTAAWIGAPAPAAPLDFTGASWIWSPGSTTGNAPAGPRWFRAAVDLPGDATEAELVATADDDFTLFLNGQQVLHAPEQVDGWRTARHTKVPVAGGRVVLAALATNRGSVSVNPGGLLVRFRAGARELVTGAGWKVAETEQSGWQQPDFDDSGWAGAVVLAPYGQGPWGSGVSVQLPPIPAPLLRREFTVDRPVASARLYISGLAYYEAEINGKRVGTQVLDPGFTDYDRTVLYTTHDVTGLLTGGANAIGVTLGRGFYAMTTPNVWRWEKPDWRGEPKLLAQLEITHPDGSRTTITSDTSWRLADGPTVSDSLYAGESYDARLVQPGWSSTGFDDSAWRAPVAHSAPKGVVRGQQHEPIEIVETVTPVSVTTLRPGVFVADMGRTMAGWTQLTVRAPAGTTVELWHGERLREDGSVIWENGHVPGRHQKDFYTCAGTGDETWEPKFSYKGFRYVEVHGLSTPPKLLGRVVHTKVREVATFRCSEPFFEQLDRAMRRTLLNNLHGIPTDTPMYEKNGWTGDAQVGAPCLAYAFEVPRFLTKWIGDLADSQNEPGQVPVIVPSGGWGYQELAPAPEWTTVYPFLVREMYRWYGDKRVAEEHWQPLTRYLDWEIGRLQNGLAVTALGDYLPPGYGGVPPEDTRLTATAYLHRALVGTAELGDLLGHTEDAARYRSVADGLRDALNAAFLGPEGHYRTAKDPDYRQTSNAIPLAFGLVPAGAVKSVVDSLVADVRARGDHLNTGNLGTSVLLRVLTEHGHADVAHAIATQRSYPSWGYWFDNGADTMWEMWQLDSRSRDHYFQGTVVQWLHENVAGLRPGDDGYRTFTVRPDARTGVHWAGSTVETVRGRAGVNWAKVGGGLRVTVDVPVGSTAEVHLPAAAAGDVTSVPAAEFLRMDRGCAVYRATHGRWRFVGRTP
ncbi:alpha-L-rhamnosidase [Amycolatopsis sp. YIM 10]|uniref:alpha-L-rhamnosidase n=1 Tax=Amycolatopsis sp. YIM 10 TaxID=2653857 RepID=UPI00129083B2|nr:alpha-L-rhamnosidase [Amycolatopsis sp. YIM 10]QFU86450.1 Bacterial alpha-L-rhamnosidase [Amycolatopsis sp. YIM 10]